MSISIQHLRDSEANVSSSDFVVPEGEIMLVKVGNHYKLKIGNGSTTASLLPYLGFTKKVLPSISGVFTLQNGFDYVFETIPGRFRVTLGSTVGSAEEFETRFSFNVPQNGTSFEFEAVAYFTGDDCEDGIFTPQALKHYTVTIYYDDSYQAVVRGIPYDPEE